MLLVAIGCGRVPGILDIDKNQSFVVFGSMDDLPLSHFADYANSNMIVTKVYFYETG